MVNGVSSGDLKLSEGHVYHGREDGPRNRFRYPIFYILFPAAAEPRLTARLNQKFLGLISFNQADYLDGKDGTLDSNVQNFLRLHCGYEAEEIWLHTMPRMFGYAFNPVSFWYCKKNGKLDAVLVEVNNTFGERHFYFMNPESGLAAGAWYTTKKAFHVSPFFPVSGYYKFRFNLSEQKFKVDINLFSDDDRLKLSTWIGGEIRPLDQYFFLKLIFKYGWMTPLVVLRIHFQAARLWFKKAKFHRKPQSPDKLVS